jgi:hypothetical protein
METYKTIEETTEALIPVVKRALSNRHSSWPDIRQLEFHLDQLRILHARSLATISGESAEVKSSSLNGHSYKVPGYSSTDRGKVECLSQVRMTTSRDAKEWRDLLTRKYSRRAHSPCRDWYFIVEEASNHYQTLQELTSSVKV